MVPNLFASTNPGDLFVLRNVGNLIPPYDTGACDQGTLAVVEFAVFSLQVSDIIVCGHSECGAIRALREGVDTCCTPHLTAWLQHGNISWKTMETELQMDPRLAKHNQISQLNVLQQIHHLKSYPFIQERVQQRKLQIHGWWFDIAQASVYSYEPSLRRFVLIDEEEGMNLLARMRT